jgi:diketogulonate reductase-like aldo/keto reductase
LRWNVQRGVSIVSKSTKIARIEENINIFDFKLTAREVNLKATYYLYVASYYIFDPTLNEFITS